MTSITYTNGNKTVILPIGFSWTTLLFGFMPSLLRQHWPAVGVGLALDIMVPMLFAKSGDTLVIWMFLRTTFAVYRNQYLHNFYIENGWNRPMATPLYTPAANL